MKRSPGQQGAVFSYIGLEQRVPKDHLLRAIREMTDAALCELDGEFCLLYARRGRPSIAPEKLMRAQLLQILYSVRSERQLMEQIDYNLLFCWFVGPNIDDPVWDVTVFTKNRERLMEGGIAEQMLLAVVEEARARQLLSEEHFTVDGTLIQAWANRRSFREKSDPPTRGSGVRGQLAHGQRAERSGVRHQPAKTQTGGEGVWLGEAGPGGSAGEVAGQGPGRLAVSADGYGAQPASSAKADSGAVKPRYTCLWKPQIGLSETETNCITTASQHRKSAAPLSGLET